MEFIQNLLGGAVSGFIGANAGELFDKIAPYIRKLGAKRAFTQLKELGIFPQIAKNKQLRNYFIERLFASEFITATERGKLLEELMWHTKYSNMDWIGPVNGPLDFIDVANSFGVQLKSVAKPALTGDGWSNLRAGVKKGLDQLREALDAGTITTGRLDVQIPAEFVHLKDEFLDKKKISLDLENPASPYHGIEIVIGSFTD